MELFMNRQIDKKGSVQLIQFYHSLNNYPERIKSPKINTKYICYSPDFTNPESPEDVQLLFLW